MATSIVDISPMDRSSLDELEAIIKRALRKTGALKELDLCAYLSHSDGPLTPSTYLKLKDTDRVTLLNLIKENILDMEPLKIPISDQEKPSILSYTGKSLEECIKEAMIRVNVLKDTDLCKYIPYNGGYLHHFTYFKIKNSNPVQIRNLIKEHILDRMPKVMPPKPRKKYETRRHAEIHESPEPLEDESLESVILKAMRRNELNLQHEEDLCRYLPRGDSFLHPMAYRSLKRNNPRKLALLIKEYVIKPENPQMLKWKKIDQNPSEFSSRSNVREKFRNLEQSGDTKIDRLLETVGQLIAVLQGRDCNYAGLHLPPKENLSRQLLSKKCYQIIQKELLIKILEGKVDHDLWKVFADLVEN